MLNGLLSQNVEIGGHVLSGHIVGTAPVVGRAAHRKQLSGHFQGRP